MAQPSFDLLTSPWIPVRDPAGNMRLLGLRQTLLDAGRVAAVDAAHPLHCFALYRLLLAIAHRAVGPGNLDARVAIVDAWPVDRIDAYLALHADAFDLFHPQRPFMQVGALAGASLYRRPWTLIALEHPSGNAKTLFGKVLDDDPGTIEPGEAARHLVAYLQFTAGGLVKAFRTSATRGPANSLACVLAEGETLAETIALNLVPQSKTEHGSDRPSWERPPLSVASLRAGLRDIPAGPAHRYTWLSRSVLLLPAPDGVVKELLFAEGVDLDDNPVPDSMSAMVAGKAGLRPLRLSESRAMWRDFHALAIGGGSHPPATLENAVGVRTALGRTSRTLRILCGGLLADQAKLVLWRIEQHRVPGVVLDAGSAACAKLRPAAIRAEDIGNALYRATHDLCRAWLAGVSDRSPDKDAVEAAAKALQATSSYWQGLEAPYWAFIDRLASDPDPDRVLREWERQLIARARVAWKQATERLGARARAVAAEAKASPQLLRALRPEFADPTEA